MNAKVSIEFVLSFGNEKYRKGEPVTIQTKLLKRTGTISNINPHQIELDLGTEKNRLVVIEIEKIINIRNPLDNDEDI